MVSRGATFEIDLGCVGLVTGYGEGKMIPEEFWVFEEQGHDHEQEQGRGR